MVRKQPLGLCLHYMVTAWGGDRDTEQQILGRVMQVLYDDAIIDGPELAGALAGTPTELRVSLSPMQLEDRARVWWAIGQPYRLSVNYEVRVVDIDAVDRDDHHARCSSRRDRDGGALVIARTGLRVESRVAASPVWLRLVDTFTGAPAGGPARRSRSSGGTARPGSR